MSGRVELMLARLYTDELFRERFLAAPEELLTASDLTPAERAELRELDTVGLRMHAHSLLSKRATPTPSSRPRPADHLRALWQRRKGY